MDIAKELKEFVELPQGWHYGSGVKISPITTGLVSEINDKAENYGFVTEVFPGVDGEVLLSIYGWEEDALEITVYFSDISYRLEQNDETIEEQEYINVDDVYELIDNLAKVDA